MNRADVSATQGDVWNRGQIGPKEGHVSGNKRPVKADREAGRVLHKGGNDQAARRNVIAGPRDGGICRHRVRGRDGLIAGSVQCHAERMGAIVLSGAGRELMSISQAGGEIGAGKLDSAGVAGGLIAVLIARRDGHVEGSRGEGIGRRRDLEVIGIGRDDGDR